MEMDNKLVMPASALEQLKCTICNKYLCYFPVRLSKEIGQICGRCSTDNIPDATHNIAFEAAVREFRFPCCYQEFGCSEYYLPTDAPYHESSCQFRRVQCPMHIGQACNWYGACTDLIEHFEQTHPVFLMKEPNFEVNFVDTFDENYLLPYGEELFIINRRSDGKKNTLWCKTHYMGCQEYAASFYYQISLRNSANGSTLQLDKKSVTSTEDGVTEITAKDVQDKLKNPSVIIGTIEITLCDKAADEDVESDNNFDDRVLDTIECPVCFEYMVSPIYQCLGGHSLCSQCKESLTHCPSCRAEVKDTRNFILEKVVTYLKYPCKYRENGCRVVGDGVSIKLHQKLCEYGNYDCPVKCYYECAFKSKLSVLYEHLEDVHSDNLLEVDTVHIPLDQGFLDDEDCLILKHLEKIFVLHFRIKDNAAWWCFQLVGSPENAKKYSCEIEVIDNGAKSNRILLRGDCAFLTNKEKAFADGPYFKLLFEQIQHFITDTFSFRVRVMNK